MRMPALANRGSRAEQSLAPSIYQSDQAVVMFEAKQPRGFGYGAVALIKCQRN